jgi:hypothetical protein
MLHPPQVLWLIEHRRPGSAERFILLNQRRGKLLPGQKLQRQLARQRPDAQVGSQRDVGSQFLWPGKIVQKGQRRQRRESQPIHSPEAEGGWFFGLIRKLLADKLRAGLGRVTDCRETGQCVSFLGGVWDQSGQRLTQRGGGDVERM